MSMGARTQATTVKPPKLDVYAQVVTADQFELTTQPGPLVTSRAGEAGDRYTRSPAAMSGRPGFDLVLIATAPGTADELLAALDAIAKVR